MQATLVVSFFIWDHIQVLFRLVKCPFSGSVCLGLCPVATGDLFSLGSILSVLFPCFSIEEPLKWSRLHFSLRLFHFGRFRIARIVNLMLLIVFIIINLILLLNIFRIPWYFAAILEPI